MRGSENQASRRPTIGKLSNADTSCVVGVARMTGDVGNNDSNGSSSLIQSVHVSARVGVDCEWETNLANSIPSELSSSDFED